MAVYGDLPTAAGRPAVRLNMIASVDSATTLAGVSGGLGGRADHALFAVLRSLADVVLVAAGPVRAERYRPSATPIAVVSRSLRLDWDARFFTAPVARPILVTVAQAPPDQLARAAEVAEVVIAGDRDVDLATALAALGDRGWRAVLAEGGPTLNGQLARAGLLDELCLTLSPWLASGDAGGSWTAGRSPPPAACDPARSASRTGSCFSAIARDAPSRRADMGQGGVTGGLSAGLPIEVAGGMSAMSGGCHA